MIRIIWKMLEEFIQNFFPKTHNPIFAHHQTEHKSDRACQDDANYTISLFWPNIWRRSSILKFDLIYILKWPSWGPGGQIVLSKHKSKAHWSNDHIDQVWSKSDENYKRSSLFSEKLKTTNEQRRRRQSGIGKAYL